METATLKDDTAPGRELAGLTAQARTAYQEKRTKECIDLTNRILQADPNHGDARAIREAVQSDIQRDLNDAKALLEDSRKMTEGQKYRKAAEIILLKILYLDSTHSEAKHLLAEAKGSAFSIPSTPSVRVAQLEEAAFTASPTPVAKQPVSRSQGMSFRYPLIFAGAVLLGGGLWFFSSQATNTIEPDSKTASAVDTQPSNPVATGTNRALVKEISIDATPVPPAPPRAAAVVPVPPLPAERPTTPPVTTTPANTATTPKPAVGRDGSLAVNSAIAADIYLAGKYLGSTPTTLPLSPGRYALEYRHGDLRAFMNHEIKPNETTTALVVFETTVHLNARPWAQVYIEGSTRRSLGQTPLSSVRVPIGSQLTFENPNFNPKTHRVTEGDSAIQVVFQ